MTDQTAKKPQAEKSASRQLATMYHVTVSSNLLSIAREGVSPQFSQGKLKRSYWVIGSLVQWALLHISNRKNVPVSSLRVLSAQIPLRQLVNTSMPGVYAVKEPMFVSTVDQPDVYYQKDLLYGQREA